MPSPILFSLSELRKQSAKSLSPTTIGLIQSHTLPRALVTPVRIANANWAVKPLNGASSLIDPKNRQLKRKVKTLSIGHEQTITLLNRSLLGSESYPILTTALGIAGGFVSSGGSLFFGIATTALSATNTSYQVLARTGDEIWHVEEIGKVDNKATYVSSYFIEDPYRRHSLNKGWLIHEERVEILLS